MILEDKIEKRILGKTKKIEVDVVISPLTKEEARENYPYRPNNGYSESRFGGNNLVDDISLLLSEDAKRCEMCTAPTKIRYLDNGSCPDCDGRSEYNGTNPREIY